MKKKSTAIAASATTQSISHYMVLQLTRLKCVLSPGKTSFMESLEITAAQASSAAGLQRLQRFCQNTLDNHFDSGDRIDGIYSKNLVKNLMGLLAHKAKVAPNEKIKIDTEQIAADLNTHIAGAAQRLISSSSWSTVIRYSALELYNYWEEGLIAALQAQIYPTGAVIKIDVLKDRIQDFRSKRAYYGKSFEIVTSGLPIVKVTCVRI